MTIIQTYTISNELSDELSNELCLINAAKQ